MSSKTKKKLCWNCDGQVDLSQENCPFCAVYLGIPPESGEDGREDILAPPYKIIETDEENVSATHARPMPMTQNITSYSSPRSFSHTLLALFLLSAGLLFFLFGVALFLFSENGILTLRWNGSLWYLYLLGALPLLVIGWRLSQKADEPL